MNIQEAIKQYRQSCFEDVPSVGRPIPKPVVWLDDLGSIYELCIVCGGYDFEEAAHQWITKHSRINDRGEVVKFPEYVTGYFLKSEQPDVPLYDMRMTITDERDESGDIELVLYCVTVCAEYTMAEWGVDQL